MKKTTYNAMLAILTLATFTFIGFIATTIYTPETELHPVYTDQTESLRTWKQAVNTEYTKQGIEYRGD